MQKYLRIPNEEGEELDTLIEGNEQAKATIIFVHGFATDKHETARYFDNIAEVLTKDYRIVRFDFSGCGKSEGKTELINYEKQAGDLDNVIDFVKKNYQGKIYILAQSMGCFVTALLNPQGIEKTIFTGLPNSNTAFITNRLIQRFGSRLGGHIDFDGISVLPRSSGVHQKIGPSFWKVLLALNPVEKVSAYAKHTELLVVHPKQDEIVGTEYLEEYAQIPDITIEWLDGDHSFKKDEDRKKLIERIKSFFIYAKSSSYRSG